MFRALTLISLNLALAGLSFCQVPSPQAAPPAPSAVEQAKPEEKAAPAPETKGDTPKEAAPAQAEPAEGAKPGLNADSKAGDAKNEAARPAAADKNVYTVGPEDSLYIRVWHEPDLSGTLDVRPDGYISMQLIGEMKVDGMSLSQLSAAITTRLQDFIKNPEVNVQLLKVGSKKYSIHGEVNRPGTFPLTSPVTVMEALVNSAGFRDFANTKKIYLLRGSQRFNFNYKQVSKGKNLEQNIQVQNGDQIFVP